ncbi:MAG TPA: 3',5'-cyclic-nucleotide phosphodiesterase [Pyrinomonadaceae bacterium]|nr:3',5'-cyclic-nucleotide phosphodiesterase [Pyrinomonadaceae bacterium]
MRFQLLPSTFSDDGSASPNQHLTCFVVDGHVAFDAGSLAMATSAEQKAQIRDVVLTHAHLDHIAGLPLFIDDLFATLDKPVRIHASAEVIAVLERDIFNWHVYPRFSELSNKNGAVMEYRTFRPGVEFGVGNLKVTPIEVNHKVPTTGFVVSNGAGTIALTGDTASMDGFWHTVNAISGLSAILIECAFPDDLADLAEISHHLTPSRLASELKKFEQNCPIFVINLKPMYRERIIEQLEGLSIGSLSVLEVGKVYEW